MSIKIGDKDLFPYLEDYRPINIYKGEHKLAGWKWAEQSSQEVNFENTYKDAVRVGVDGKSVQDGEPTPDYPVEIHSLNDFNVVSQKSEGGVIDGIEVGGRNYLPLSRGDLESYNPYNTDWEISDKTIESVINMENNNLNLTLSYVSLSEPIATGEIITFSGFLKVNNEIPEKHPFIDNRLRTGVDLSQLEFEYNKDTGYFKSTYPSRGSWVIHARTTLVKGDKISIYKPKVEKGNIATPWTPAPEDITENDNHPLIDKINLSLSEPLRSIGDVKDRLFRDSDGLWKIERNVNHILLDGNQTLTVSHEQERTLRVRYQPGVELLHIPTSDGLVKTSRFKTVPNAGNWNQDRELAEQDISMVSIRINKSRLNGVTSSDVNNWFRSNPTEVLYTPSAPTIKTLDQELQDKLNNLRSFQDSNYVYTVIDKTDILSENLKPTIHAQLKVKEV